MVGISDNCRQRQPLSQPALQLSCLPRAHLFAVVQALQVVVPEVLQPGGSTHGSFDQMQQTEAIMRVQQPMPPKQLGRQRHSRLFQRGTSVPTLQLLGSSVLDMHSEKSIQMG